MAIIALLVVSAILADVIAPHDPAAMNLMDRFSPPVRDLLDGHRQPRPRHLLAAPAGRADRALRRAHRCHHLRPDRPVLGMLAGFGPRWLDNALLFFFDTLRAYPTIILALALAALMPRGLSTVIIVVVITSFAEYGRVVRTQTLSLKNSEFILAERAMGASFARIVFHHILPNVLGPFFILAAMNLPVVITIEAGMSFPRHRRARPARRPGARRSRTGSTTSAPRPGSCFPAACPSSLPPSASPSWARRCATSSTQG
jgi:peptide/nickel transport system permease protein